MPNALISTAELQNLLTTQAAPIKLLDASYALPNSGLDPKAAWQKERIDNAAFFDIDVIADHARSLPHMLPTPADFSQAVAALGISNDDLVVVYDQTGIAMAAARAWWMFRIFGHDNVKILNGGLPRWKQDGLSMTTAPFTPVKAGAFQATFRPHLVKSLQEVLASLDDRATTIIDARPAERFAGQAPEPRQGLRSGHIPGSRNIPAASLIDAATGEMKAPEALETLFAPAMQTPSVIATCGSGATACTLALGLYQLGFCEAAVYDGSWAEWGKPDYGLPIDGNRL